MTALKHLKQAATELPKPTVYLESERRRVLAFGKPHDWTFRPYSNGTVPESELRKLPPALYLPQIAVDYGLPKMWFAPIPTKSNAEICTESDAMKTRLELYSELYGSSVLLWRGAYADGTVLNLRKATGVIAAAGCPIITMWGKSTHLGYAHAGRDCLIDREKIQNKKARKHESVVVSLVEAMLVANSVRDLHAEILFPIDPHDFLHPWDHSQYGEFNKLMTEYIAKRWGTECIVEYDDPKKRALGRISQDAVIRSQLIECGVLPERITSFPAPTRNKWFDTREGNSSSSARNAIIIQNV